MVLKMPGKQFWFYGGSVLCLLLSLFFIVNYKPLVSASSGGTCTGPVADSVVGYNLGAYGCDDWDHQNATLNWAVNNGNWVMVMMGTDCKQVNSGIPIDYIASHTGGNLIVRLYPGSSGIPVSDADQTNLVNNFASCLSGITSVWVEPLNEINWSRENTALFNSGGNTAMAQGVGKYLKKLVSALRAKGHKVLFPSMNPYPNAETVNPSEFISNMNLGDLTFDGVALHVYGGSYATIYNNKDSVNCIDAGICTDAILKGTTSGVNFDRNNIFITELGFLGGYVEPDMAQFLANAWPQLQGKVKAAMPFIYNPDIEGTAQCRGYYLPAAGSQTNSNTGYSSTVAVSVYNNCNVDWNSIFSGATSATNFASRLNSSLACPTNKYISCGGGSYCSAYYVCCNGFPTRGADMNACLWPEWGDEIRPCTGDIPVVDKMVCTEGLSVTGETSNTLSTWFSELGEVGKFGCNCDIRLGTMMYPTGISAPFGLVAKDNEIPIIGAKGRTAQQGGNPYSMQIPGKNYDMVWSSTANFPAAYTPSVLYIETTGSSGQKAEATVEDAAAAYEKAKSNMAYFYGIPGEGVNGLLDLEKYLKAYAEEQMIGVCKNQVNSVPAGALEYCSIQAPTMTIGQAGTWVIESTIDRTISFFNPCKQSIKDIQFYVTDTFTDIMQQYDLALLGMTAYPGGGTECDNVGELYVEVSAYICGKQYDNLKLYFPGVLKFSCLIGEAYDQMYGMPGHMDISEAYVRLTTQGIPPKEE
ncbi:hypothetical protein JW962_02285 [Candidatus Dojkabacteria bacterium]|nr:hypothetical protein [Candidatus Dojkabacteria bacterium]